MLAARALMTPRLRKLVLAKPNSRHVSFPFVRMRLASRIEEASFLGRREPSRRGRFKRRFQVSRRENRGPILLG
jgi:hypothetical protein